MASVLKAFVEWYQRHLSVRSRHLILNLPNHSSTQQSRVHLKCITHQWGKKPLAPETYFLQIRETMDLKWICNTYLCQINEWSWSCKGTHVRSTFRIEVITHPWYTLAWAPRRRRWHPASPSRAAAPRYYCCSLTLNLQPLPRHPPSPAAPPDRAAQSNAVAAIQVYNPFKC